jgi:hypothetical protein
MTHSDTPDTVSDDDVVTQIEDDDPETHAEPLDEVGGFLITETL